MSVELDLTALEAAATVAVEAAADWIKLSDALDAFHSKARPSAVLALIARVRELEQQLTDERVESSHRTDVARGWSEKAAAAEAKVEKLTERLRNAEASEQHWRRGYHRVLTVLTERGECA